MNQEKNNNLLPYSSISGNCKTGTNGVNVAFDGFADADKKTNEPFVDGLNTPKAGQPLQYVTSNRKNNKNTAVNNHAMGFVSSPAKPVMLHEDVEKIKHIIPSQPELPVEKVSTLVKKPSQKRAHSVECLNGEVANSTEKKISITTKEIGKSADSLLKAINSVDRIHEVASQGKVASKPKMSAEKPKKEFKSVNIVAHRASSIEDHGPLVNAILLQPFSHCRCEIAQYYFIR